MFSPAGGKTRWPFRFIVGRTGQTTGSVENPWPRPSWPHCAMTAFARRDHRFLEYVREVLAHTLSEGYMVVADTNGRRMECPPRRRVLVNLCRLRSLASSVTARTFPLSFTEDGFLLQLFEMCAYRRGLARRSLSACTRPVRANFQRMDAAACRPLTPSISRGSGPALAT